MFLFILGLKYLQRRLRNNLDDFKHDYKICLVHTETLAAFLLVDVCMNFLLGSKRSDIWFLNTRCFILIWSCPSVPDVRQREFLEALETYTPKHENAKSRDHTRHQLRSSEDNPLEEVSDWNLYGSFSNDLYPYVNL